jgi:hypothetical protein
MTQTIVAYTDRTDSEAAGSDLGAQIAAAMKGETPGAVIVFASARYDHGQLLRALEAACHPGCLIGSSSAGEFTSGTRGEGKACALAIRALDMRFSVGVARNLGADRAAAAKQVVASFQGLATHSFPFPFRSALVLTDALAGHADDLIDQLTLATSGMYQFFGGGAGDDARFQKTHVFHGTEAITDAVVALEILSAKPMGIGVSHGWEPASDGMRVTEADGMRLVSLNGMPAVQAFSEHAEDTGQAFDRADPLPFFLHNILGIEVGGAHRLRVPLSVNEDGSIACAADIPTGAIVFIMKTSVGSAIEAAEDATRSALAGLQGNKPNVALFFDCVATRLRLGNAFGFELQAVDTLLGDASLVGCNTYGQIARAEGQFGGFHNCTAVVCVIPD